jgi:NADH-quinone oxidoreductase subunit M
MPQEPTGFGILSLLVFLPLIGSIILSLMPGSNHKALKYGALAFTIATFAVSVFIYTGFNADTYHFQMVELVPWIKPLGINYKVGVDGISIWLLLLTTFLSIIAVWFSFYVNTRVKTYMALLLALETAMLGVFVAMDLIVFYTFFEFSLIPMYFLIAIWGGDRRAYASIKFFLYTFAGSIFMLVAIIGLYVLQKEGIRTFDLPTIQALVATGELWQGRTELQTLFFWAFAVGFLIKIPAFPFHTWLPDAHVEAPTAGSVILAGVLLKMGSFGLLRYCLPLFPEAATSAAPIFMGLAVVGIIYGAIVAAVQPDLKKLIAYSSVAHMGFILAGIFSFTHAGMMGGSMQQLNHGVSTGALFLLVGLLYERRHTRMFKEFGGLKAQMPVYAALFLIVMLSSVGLPGTNGFIGEFLALLGAFEASVSYSFGLHPAYAVIAGFGVVLAAVYLLTMFMKTFYGPNENPENKRLKDIKPWELAMVGTFIVLIFWGGLYPNTFLKPMEKSIAATRLMAIAPPNSRPTWANQELEINPGLNLIQWGGTPDKRPPNLGRVIYVNPIRNKLNWLKEDTVAAAEHQEAAH